jgi:hypothetical protein
MFAMFIAIPVTAATAAYFGRMSAAAHTSGKASNICLLKAENVPDDRDRKTTEPANRNAEIP